ncbi:MAG: DUF6326 family protein [Ginsengibacter sp.]|jgi:hypothetical protein
MNSGKTNQYNLDDFRINIKIKLAALWTSVTLCYLYGDYFELYVPKQAESLVNGTNFLDSPSKLFLAALVLSIPAIMVFLSIILKPKINRWLNIIFGVFFTAVMLMITVNSLTPWRIFYVFLALVECLITSLIVFYAWRWPGSSLKNSDSD